MNQPDLFPWEPPRRRPARTKGAQEWKIVSVRETAPGRTSLLRDPVSAKPSVGSSAARRISICVFVNPTRWTKWRRHLCENS